MLLAVLSGAAAQASRGLVCLLSAPPSECASASIVWQATRLFARSFARDSERINLCCCCEWRSSASAAAGEAKLMRSLRQPQKGRTPGRLAAAEQQANKTTAAATTDAHCCFFFFFFFLMRLSAPCLTPPNQHWHHDTNLIMLRDSIQRAYRCLFARCFNFCKGGVV